METIKENREVEVIKMNIHEYNQLINKCRSEGRKQLANELRNICEQYRDKYDSITIANIFVFVDMILDKIGVEL